MASPIEQSVAIRLSSTENAHCATLKARYAKFCPHAVGAFLFAYCIHPNVSAKAFPSRPPDDVQTKPLDTLPFAQAVVLCESTHRAIHLHFNPGGRRHNHARNTCHHHGPALVFRHKRITHDLMLKVGEPLAAVKINELHLALISKAFRSRKKSVKQPVATIRNTTANTSRKRAMPVVTRYQVLAYLCRQNEGVIPAEQSCIASLPICSGHQST